jgi:hypothetical protein
MKEGRDKDSRRNELADMVSSMDTYEELERTIDEIRIVRLRVSWLGGGADEAATGFDGKAALTAKGAIFGLEAVDFHLNEGVRFHGKFDGAAAAVNQRTRGHDASSSFLNYVNGFFGGTAGGPDILDDEDVLIGAKGKATAQGHDAVLIALNEQGRDATAERVVCCRERAGNLLANNHAAECGRNDRVDAGIREQLRQGLTKFFGKPGILQHQGALDVGVAMKAAGELKMTVPNGAGALKQLKELFAFLHDFAPPS